MDSRNRSPLPVGVKFKPTDQQLLQYLNFKIHALPYFKGAVLDCDLYGEIEPWEIWLRFGGINGEYLYFFTKLKRLTNNSEHLWAHINRKIGLANGTWSGENSASPIFATKTDKQIIGYCKCFRFVLLFWFQFSLRIFNLLFVFLEHLGTRMSNCPSTMVNGLCMNIACIKIQYTKL